MHIYLAIAGVGLNLIGAFILALADTWFSRSALIYMDALETSLSKVVVISQNRGTLFENIGVDSKRDRASGDGQGQLLSPPESDPNWVVTG